MYTIALASSDTCLSTTIPDFSYPDHTPSTSDTVDLRARPYT